MALSLNTLPKLSYGIEKEGGKNCHRNDPGARITEAHDINT